MRGQIAMPRDYLRLIVTATAAAYKELMNMEIAPDSRKEAIGLALFEWRRQGGQT